MQLLIQSDCRLHSGYEDLCARRMKCVSKKVGWSFWKICGLELGFLCETGPIFFPRETWSPVRKTGIFALYSRDSRISRIICEDGVSESESKPVDQPFTENRMFTGCFYLLIFAVSLEAHRLCRRVPAEGPFPYPEAADLCQPPAEVP